MRKRPTDCRETIFKKFWSLQEQLIADTTELKHFSQQANALAVWLDVVPREQQAEAITRVYSATDAGVSFRTPDA